MPVRVTPRHSQQLAALLAETRPPRVTRWWVRTSAPELVLRVLTSEKGGLSPGNARGSPARSPDQTQKRTGRGGGSDPATGNEMGSELLLT